MLTRLLTQRALRAYSPYTAFSQRYKSDSAYSSNSNKAKSQSLPAPGEGTPITLDVSGEGSTVKLSEMGPLVVNVDGTVARISNWAEMTDAERETTFRMVGKRNKVRLEALKRAKEEQGSA